MVDPSGGLQKPRAQAEQAQKHNYKVTGLGNDSLYGGKMHSPFDGLSLKENLMICLFERNSVKAYS